ncbi:MAG: hypothetical protein NTV34_19960 [Proteobacteria bacterium]|nr:hypothetical protein [Pseudomonadota bacterium]
MAKIVPPKVRLADASTSGAEIYNYYQLVSMLSSFYVKALDRKDEPAFASLWDDCAASILEQIGSAHNCWEKVQKEVASGIPLPIHEPIVKRTLTLVKRFYILERQLTDWTPLGRWARVLLLVEAQMMRINTQIALNDPFLREPLAAMSHGFTLRLICLRKMEGQIIKENAALESQFAEVVVL